MKRHKTYENKALEFISAIPRNKLLVVTKEIGNIDFLRLDEDLSIILKEVISESQFSLKAKDLISAYFNDNQMNSNQYGKHLAIADIGILLEKELQFDFKSFVDQYSQNQTLFLQWEGEIIDNKLYFLTKRNGLEIDISNLSHIVI